MIWLNKELLRSNRIAGSFRSFKVIKDESGLLKKPGSIIV